MLYSSILSLRTQLEYIPCARMFNTFCAHTRHRFLPWLRCVLIFLRAFHGDFTTILQAFYADSTGILRRFYGYFTAIRVFYGDSTGILRRFYGASTCIFTAILLSLLVLGVLWVRYIESCRSPRLFGAERGSATWDQSPVSFPNICGHDTGSQASRTP